MQKAPWVAVTAISLALGAGARSARAVELAVQAVGAAPSQLSDYQVGGQVIDGSGIRIADIDSQIDPDHPALAGKINSHTDYSGEGILDPDTEFTPYNTLLGHQVWVNDMHATAVAGIMVSNGLDSTGAQTGHIGIAPGARVDIAKYWRSDLSKNINSAITASFDLTAGGASILLVEDQEVIGNANGSTQITRALDYVAMTRDTLVVIPAGNSGPNNQSFSTPADAYNGLTVGATDESYNQIAAYSNRGPTDDLPIGRAKPDLVAPGSGLRVPFGGWEDDDGRDGSAAVNYQHTYSPADVTQFMAPNITPEEDIDADWATVAGTSFSAPLVAGAGALLQQWGGHNGLDTSNETLRAVIINSTNKIDGILGMSRTILDNQGLDWLASEANLSQAIPLDDQMGAGQLDVTRAMQQYDAGEQGPGLVASIGWDKHTALTEGDTFDYLLEGSLEAGDFISATLAWDRDVLYLDNGETGVYEPVDFLLGLPLDNLDLYLMHHDDTATEQAIWSSVSTVDNLEHLFWQIQEPGDYKLRVVFAEDVTFSPGLENNPDFTLAWWAGVPEPASGAILALMGVVLLNRSRPDSTHY